MFYHKDIEYIKEELNEIKDLAKETKAAISDQEHRLTLSESYLAMLKERSMRAFQVQIVLIAAVVSLIVPKAFDAITSNVQQKTPTWVAEVLNKSDNF
jgi:hypothetical protein